MTGSILCLILSETSQVRVVDPWCLFFLSFQFLFYFIFFIFAPPAMIGVGF